MQKNEVQSEWIRLREKKTNFLDGYLLNPVNHRSLSWNPNEIPYAHELEINFKFLSELVTLLRLPPHLIINATKSKKSEDRYQISNAKFGNSELAITRLTVFEENKTYEPRLGSNYSQMTMGIPFQEIAGDLRKKNNDDEFLQNYAKEIDKIFTRFFINLVLLRISEIEEVITAYHKINKDLLHLFLLSTKDSFEFFMQKGLRSVISLLLFLDLIKFFETSSKNISYTLKKLSEHSDILQEMSLPSNLYKMKFARLKHLYLLKILEIRQNLLKESLFIRLTVNKD